MAKAALFVLIAAAAGLIVYLLAAPRFVHPHAPAAPPDQSSPAPGAAPPPTQSDIPNVRPPNTMQGMQPRSNTVDSAPAIDVPKTGEERSHEDLEARRGPLYDWIRTNLQKILLGWQPSKDDPATLDLYMARADPANTTLFMEKLVQPYASRYGFDHVRFYVAAVSGESSDWHLDSEATPDTDGVWHLYKK